MEHARIITVPRLASTLLPERRALSSAIGSWIRMGGRLTPLVSPHSESLQYSGGYKPWCYNARARGGLSVGVQVPQIPCLEIPLCQRISASFTEHECRVLDSIPLSRRSYATPQINKFSFYPPVVVSRVDVWRESACAGNP